MVHEGIGGGHGYLCGFTYVGCYALIFPTGSREPVLPDFRYLRFSTGLEIFPGLKP
jgi:hypothetical protein